MIDLPAQLRALADLRSILHDALGGPDASPQPAEVLVSLQAQVTAAEDALWPGYGDLRRGLLHAVALSVAEVARRLAGHQCDEVVTVTDRDLTETTAYAAPTTLTSASHIYGRHYSDSEPALRSRPLVTRLHGKSVRLMPGFANPRRSALGGWGRSLVAALRPLIQANSPEGTTQARGRI